MGNTLLDELKHAISEPDCSLDMIECIIDKYDYQNNREEEVNESTD